MGAGTAPARKTVAIDSGIGQRWVRAQGSDSARGDASKRCVQRLGLRGDNWRKPVLQQPQRLLYGRPVDPRRQCETIVAQRRGRRGNCGRRAQCGLVPDAQHPTFDRVAGLQHLGERSRIKPRERGCQDTHLCAVLDLIGLYLIVNNVSNQRGENFCDYKRCPDVLERSHGKVIAVLFAQRLQTRNTEQGLRSHGTGCVEFPARLRAAHALLPFDAAAFG